MTHTYQPRSLLMATLGAEPQVVTATLELLKRQGDRIDRAMVFHTASTEPPIHQAVERLAEISRRPPPRASWDLQLALICDRQGQAVLDVQTPEQTEAAFRFLYRQIQAAKLDGWRIHLLIASGRKTLALFGISAAQLLFDEDDRLWHLYSAGDFLASRRLYPGPGDEAHLIPIPVTLWSQVSPALTDLRRIDDPFQAVERVKRLRLAEKLERARSFLLGALTAAEREAVRRLVCDGLSDQEIGGQLAISPRTVEQHLRSAYRKAAAHWELEDVSRAGLVSLLSIYYLMDCTE